MTSREDIKLQIDKAVRCCDDIVFICYSLIDNAEENARYTLTKILEKYNKDDWFIPIFSCLKELTTNAIKANAKKVLTDEGIIKKEDDVVEVIRKIRSILNERANLEYGLKIKKKKLSTRIYFQFKPGMLIIQVINNLPLSVKELKRLGDRIEQSAKYDNLAEIYLDCPDPEAEGMGLGISMVVTLLKSINISHRNFSIRTDRVGKTYAQMDIPLE
jgi:hypothetical protein